jgi:hypothetical protein
MNVPNPKYANDFQNSLAVEMRTVLREHRGRRNSNRFKNTAVILSSERGGLQSLISDVHTQKHIWTIFEGEREWWRMPAVGSKVPDAEPASEWRSWIVETDAAGNITHQQIAGGGVASPGASITRATGRGFGRLSGNTRFFGIAGNAVEQGYAYADGGSGGSSAPGPSSGLLGRSSIAIGSFVLAGSEIARDAEGREEIATDLGITARQTGFGYDDRGRMKSYAHGCE